MSTLMSASTTILFVPGAWHSPQAFAVVGKLLKDQAGYDIRYAVLPSVTYGGKATSFDSDVASVRSQIQKAADEGQRIVLFCHSYGAMPSNEAIKGLDLASRKKQGLPGGVAHIFFCCSFVIPEGTSLHSAGGGKVQPWYNVSDDETSIECNDPKHVFYNDMSENEAEAAISTLKPQSYGAFKSPCTYAAWKEVPSTYLYCFKDNAIPYAFQKTMVEQWAKGYEFRTETLDSSHSPFLSMPEETAAAIRRAAES